MNTSLRYQGTILPLRHYRFIILMRAAYLEIVAARFDQVEIPP
ncbi:MAG: hypothetical protein ABSA13_09035 [Beijerinckiaceae bacterium]|jgi:hypothetical protein